LRPESKSRPPAIVGLMLALRGRIVRRDELE
jgi:hypothetical protein